MSIYFVDTSAFAKRYLPEVGSGWVRSWMLPKGRHTIIISELGMVEFVALLARRQRENSISSTEFTRLKNAFLQHTRRYYSVIDLDKTILVQARQLVARHPLRSLDAIHLASARAALKAVGTKPIFVSADQKLLAAASAEGFSVDDPNAHP